MDVSAVAAASGCNSFGKHFEDAIVSFARQMTVGISPPHKCKKFLFVPTDVTVVGGSPGTCSAGALAGCLEGILPAMVRAGRPLDHRRGGGATSSRTGCHDLLGQNIQGRFG